MAIEFPCPACQALMRTADGTAGRPVRCPGCCHPFVVPGQGVEDAVLTAELADPDRRSAPLNPYAAFPLVTPEPGSSLSRQQLLEQTRHKLLWPGTGLLFCAVSGLGIMALAGFGFASNPEVLFDSLSPEPTQRAEALGFIATYFTVGFATRTLQLLGAVAMIRQTGYGLAYAGALSALIPCEIYCGIPSFPLGIWALMVLHQVDVKAALRA